MSLFSQHPHIMRHVFYAAVAHSVKAENVLQESNHLILQANKTSQLQHSGTLWNTYLEEIAGRPQSGFGTQKTPSQDRT